MGNEEIITLKLTAQISRYGEIAERWPKTITVEGTRKQIGRFLVMGMPDEAGCDYLFATDSEHEALGTECEQAYFKREERRKLTIKGDGHPRT